MSPIRPRAETIVTEPGSRSLAAGERESFPRPARGVSAILTQLRRAIETGAYGEGDQLPPERQLAVTFRAARGTVRRALDQLEQAGLVSRRLGSGTFVTARGAEDRLTDEYIDLISPLQLIEARFAVEPHTTRLAVLNATRRDLDEMQATLAELEDCHDDKDEFTKWDAEFHLRIARASRNPLLVNVYGQINKVRLHAQWDVMKEKILTPGVIREYHRQHRAIYEAIDQRDAQRAQDLITAHLGKARDDLLRANSR
jgi:DNA-binding FadR family transcriptional regulator